MPTVSLAASKDEILLNANNHNWQPPAPGSPDPDAGRWKSAKQTFIPAKRDFDATNLWQDDPDLEALTVTIGGGYAGTLEVKERATDEGLIKFWEDRKKTKAFTTLAIQAGQDPKAVTLFVEGYNNSRLANDVFAQATFTLATNPKVKVEKETGFTVGPVVNSFTATPSTVRFINGADGRDGLEGGKWLGDGNPGTVDGMRFEASVMNFGTMPVGFVQNLLDVKNGSNGATAGAVDTVAANSKNVLPVVGSGITLPGAVLDSDAPDNPVMGQVATQVGQVITLKATDNPGLGPPKDQGNSINTYDVREYFKTYLTVQYLDQSLYTLGYVTWDINFHATRAANSPNTWADTLNPVSKFTVGPTQTLHDEVAVTVGPIANGNITWR
jgi:hypothetical protein